MYKLPPDFNNLWLKVFWKNIHPCMRSGAGCVLDDAELVGGDLPVIVGGGGITLDRDDADECFNRCEENPRCTWYTYDTRYMYVQHLKCFHRTKLSSFLSSFLSKPRVLRILL